MDRCDRVERIFDCYLHFVAAPHADDWSKNRRRIAIGSGRLSLNEGVWTGHDPQVDGISLFRGLDQLRYW